MDVQSVILGFLMRKSMTGYDLKKAFSISFSFFSGLSYGSIYPALKKMESRGLISKRMEIQDGAPNRKVYSITEDGKEVLLESLRSPFAFEQPKNIFLMKLFFFAHLSPEERKTIAGNYLNSIEQFHRQLESVGPEVKERADRFQYLCFEFGLRFFRDLARNLSEVVQALENDESQNEQ
ncbi:MAG: helix-turn-helix transcriptional regulator [Desulfomonile tiedjei]|nr:helix-turn-helix transcriptional regulator [Desulfomonile tiedjei]